MSRICDVCGDRIGWRAWPDAMHWIGAMGLLTAHAGCFASLPKTAEWFLSERERAALFVRLDASA